MTEGGFVRSISQAYSLFDEFGLARAFQVPSSLSINQNFNAIALDVESAYEDVFFCGLRNAHLNFILKDLTFFQFSRSSEVEARYAFYPSPFSQKSINLLDRFILARDRGDIDEEAFSHAIETLPLNSRRPVLRYEYSLSQYKRVKHPLSHLHIGTGASKNRCFQPVTGACGLIASD